MALDLWTYLTSTHAWPLDAMNYNEYEESGDIGIATDSSDVTIVYQVDDSQHLAFINDLLGYSKYANEATGDFTINRVLPQQHTEFDYFYAAEAHDKRIGVSTTTNLERGNIGQWVVSRITTHFRPLDYRILADASLPNITIGSFPNGGAGTTVPDEKARYVTRTFNYVTEMLSLNNRMKFVSRSGVGTSTDAIKTLDYSPGMLTSQCEAVYIWHQVPARTYDKNLAQNLNCIFFPPNLAYVMALQGCVNSNTFDGYPPGTVLFCGFEPRLVKPALDTGIYTWEMQYRFLIRNQGLYQTLPNCTNAALNGLYVGHNFIFDGQNYRWDLVTTTGSYGGANDFQIYPSADLNALFVITQNSQGF